LDFDKKAVIKKIEEVFEEKRLSSTTLSSSLGSMIGLHVENTDYDFDAFQEMRHYKLKPEEEFSIDEKI
jgi:hypothetical protein